MAKGSRSAFTLVELLVVVAIIGLLASLILAGTLRAREAARRTQCINNQQEIGKAVLQYETSKQYYPGYVNNSLASANRRPISWLVTLLPYLGRDDMWRLWRVSTTGDSLATLAASDMALFKCPSDSDAVRVLSQKPTSYVANTGVKDDFNDTNGYDRIYNGVFHYAYSMTNAVRVRSTDIKDGLQQTLMLSENLQGGYWTDPPDSSTTNLGKAEANLGMVWWADPVTNVYANIDQGKDDGTYLANIDYARPSSNHGGTVVVTYCDGHTDTLDNDIDYSVFRSLMTPNGASAGY